MADKSDKKTVRAKLDEQAIVVKDNRLIEKTLNLTLREQKIIFALASTIDKNDKSFNIARFKVQDLADLLEIRVDAFYSELKAITRQLLNKRSIQIEELPKGGKKSKTIQVNLLASAVYYNGQGIVELEFPAPLAPYLLHLKANFTKFTLGYVVSLKSAYSFRIYELLKQYYNTQKRERFFTLHELKQRLGVGNGYARYNNFKQRVLLPAQKELKHKTDIEFTFEEEREWKKVVGIKFIIKSNEKEQAGLFDNCPVDNELVNELVSFGIASEKTAVNLIEEHGQEHVKTNLEYCKSYAQNRKVENFGGLLVQAIKNNWAYKSPYEQEQEKRLEKKIKDREELARKKEQLRDEQKTIRLISREYNAHIDGIYQSIIESLPQKQIEETENEFKSTLKGFMRDMVKRNGVNSPFCKHLFTSFVITKYKPKAKIDFVQWAKETHHLQLKAVNNGDDITEGYIIVNKGKTK